MRKNPLLVKIGQKIRLYRIEKGWSQERLGEKSDLDRTYIGGVERGERNISIINLQKISSALHVKPEDLFS